MSIDRDRSRILVTGSRDWNDEGLIGAALFDAWCGLQKPITLVHGACPTGADAIAEREWEAKSSGTDDIERHPADWSQGRKAGPLRNQQMVDLGADLCLAFIGPCTSPRCDRKDEHASHGATGCADLAEAAGIKVWRFYASQTLANLAATSDVDA